jgi:hypothetical protein
MLRSQAEPATRPSRSWMWITRLFIPNETSSGRIGRHSCCRRSLSSAEINRPNGHATADHSDHALHAPMTSVRVAGFFAAVFDGLGLGVARSSLRDAGCPTGRAARGASASAWSAAVGTPPPVVCARPIVAPTAAAVMAVAVAREAIEPRRRRTCRGWYSCVAAPVIRGGFTGARVGVVCPAACLPAKGHPFLVGSGAFRSVPLPGLAHVYDHADWVVQTDARRRRRPCPDSMAYCSK